MLRVYPSNLRYSVDLGWLRSHLSFSFGEYFDENNTSFGVMRVCNDDFVAGGKGFGPHPHSDMEIVTVVLAGAIKHEDNLGHIEITSAGEVQRMTAGSGIVHAEYNASESEELNILQLWFMPERRGLAPSFESVRYNACGLVNRLLPVVSREGGEGIASIHQDMTIYLSRLEREKQLVFTQERGRRVFLFVIDGKLAVNGVELAARDSARIEDEPVLTLAAGEDSFFMLIDLP
ncbi:pirin family protein [Brevibacillus agri]|uniref:pirin family protein n=1 Tax=Brevibacillus agri TaxID=51101 RepID=UPI00046F41EC|nr:pirin family protein [Brevibacillus agri]MBG9565608.1 pirin [Brevibacillus agri]MBY0051007.1 pirin family protein [Brevibacillus agri]MDN4095948.1 pirin family protein [Brevibacillus agri]MED1646601.1 pirin family protein [Brevibacillus agri]MED1657468.1 pirin family protein [Brevibacillus agri]